MSLIFDKLYPTGCHINGVWQAADNNQTIQITNPADNTVIASVPDASDVQINKAIDTASTAFRSWRNIDPYQRATYLHQWRKLIIENLDDLATLLTTEQGKPLAEAKAEIIQGVSYLEWFAGQGKRTDGDIIPSSSTDSKLLVVKEPIGVTAIITPWNFPVSMILRKISAVLAAGCTAVIKPSELTPLSAIALIELARQAQIPAGVINLVTGEPKKIGKLFTMSNIIKKISFTGSTKVGKLLMQECAHNIQKISLELGGHAPFIVCQDANIKSAVDGLIKSKFRNSGQTCICPNRLYLHQDIHHEFTTLLLEEITKLKLGNGLDAATTQGPLINHQAVDKALLHVTDAVSKGAKVLTGGSRAREIGDNYFSPTVLDKVSEDALIMQQETFAPVIPISTFTDIDEVIAKANTSNYGLASYFYTENLSLGFKISQALEYGMVAVNSPQFSSACAPFTGIKESGIGCEGSKYGIDEYLQLKLIKIDI
jgi:succinate-semialdehyde dehydrogenase / glutarate-semialdehyde dehydrogenase